MPLLQIENAIYHHPLDAVTGETIVGTVWTQGEGRFDTGKVGLGMEGTPSGLVFTTPVAYSNTGANQAGIRFAAARVDETRIAIAFADSRGVAGSNNQFGSGIIATVGSGPSLSFGTKNSFLIHDTIADFVAERINLHRIDTDKLIVTYRQNDTIPNTTRAAVVTVSGTSISDAPSVNINVNPTTECTSDTLDSTHFIVAYRPFDDGQNRAVVGTVSGTSIALGSPVIFSGSADNLVVVGLSSTKALVAFNRSGAGRAQVIERTGTSLSFGPEVTFTGAIGSQGSHAARWAVALSNTTAIVMNGPTGSTAHLATISGLNVTFGPGSASFASTGLISLDKVDSTTFVWASSAADGVGGRARVGFVSGTSISPGPSVVYSDGASGSGRDVAVASVGPTDDIPTHIFVTSGDIDQSIVLGQPADGTVTCLLSLADLTATSGAYTSTIGSTKVAYTAWLMDPSTQCS